MFVGSAFLGLAALAAPVDYPETPTVDHTDIYHGVAVPDPYRWLEEMQSDEVQSWIEAQNDVSQSYLSQVPGRDRLVDEFRERINYERYGIPVVTEAGYFFTRNDGLQDQSVLYFMEDLEAGEPKVVIDPNQMQRDGKPVSLNTWQPSDAGDKLLYAEAVAGSDWVDWYVQDVATGETKGGPVRWSKFGVGTWDADDDGFFYLRYPEPEEGEELAQMNLNPAIYHHEIGEDQSEDELIFTLPDNPDWWLSPILSEDGETLYLYVGPRGSQNNLLWALPAPFDGEPIKLFDENDANYSPVGKQGTVHYFWTNKDAPFGKVISVDTNDLETVNTVIPEGENTLESVDLVGGQLVAQYLQDAASTVTVYDLEGNVVEQVELPGLGTVGGFTGDSDQTETFYSYVDFTTPPTIYRYNLQSQESNLFRQPEVPIDTSDYVSKQVFFDSEDGTRVPMFIVHRQGLELDGSNPTLLYGYGGFAAAQRPWFSSSRSVWMDMGGVWAVANIRGGDEYGREWHLAGTKLQKQNTFDDFIAASEYLIDEGYTRPDKLAVQGGSNGGLLVGAVITQRPNLYGAALPAVGVLDMLRFNQFTIGKGWEGDYGSPQNPDEFEVLYSYSPYHNVREGVAYPATLVTTGDTDDRVVPAHSYKFAARLQAAQGGIAPVLLRVETAAGHGAGTPLDKVIEQLADTYAFLSATLEIEISEEIGAQE